MSRRVGIELGAAHLRVVELKRWGDGVARTFEVAWSPEEPALALAGLRKEIPKPASIAVAVGLPFLRIARVELPPASAEVRDQIVALEPERFFATRDELIVGVAPNTPLAFATPRTWLDRVLAVVSEWGVVERVEASPIAAATSLGAVTGAYALEAGDNELGLLVLDKGAIQTVRRTRDAAGAVGSRDAGSLDMRYCAAHGAALRVEQPVAGSLMSAPSRRAVRRRALSRVVLATAAAAAGVAFMGWSLDRSRERQLVALEARAQELTNQVQPSLEAQSQLASIEAEQSLIGNVLSARPNPAAALAAISTLLPDDAVIQNARFVGDQWQISGTASDAAALVPRFDADARFDSVRVLAAISRFRDGQRSRETFSIAFHVRSAP